jgi:hypothetical protein
MVCIDGSLAHPAGLTKKPIKVNQGKSSHIKVRLPPRLSICPVAAFSNLIQPNET